MPATSKSQHNYIYYLRGKYKTKSETPEKDKWIWDKGYENPTKGLPEKVSEEFSDWVLEELQLTDLLINEDNTEKVESESIKDKLKTCNRNIYYKNKESVIKAVDTLKEIGDIVKLTLSDEENQKAFDSVTLNRDAKMIEQNILTISKLAQEIKNLQQRLESKYEDVAFKLNKYFDI